MRKRNVWISILTVGILMAGIAGCSPEDKSVSTERTAVQSSAASETEAVSSSDTVKETQTETEESKSGESEETQAYRAVPDPAASDGDKILFVGNSHTYTNDLPGVFYQMAQAGGHNVDVYDLTEGSYTLARYSDPEDEMGAILTEALESEPWDFVVLQENTNAAISINAKKDMYPYARILDQKIHDAGGQTVFLMTWAPEDGAGILSREAVQGMLSRGYQDIARELDALLIPGGDIFMEALKQNSDFVLLGEDGQHPSEEGTYLAACASYALIFQETPVGNPFLFDLEEEKAAEIQALAENCMLGGGEAAQAEDGL